MKQRLASLEDDPVDPLAIDIKTEPTSEEEEEFGGFNEKGVQAWFIELPREEHSRTFLCTRYRFNNINDVSLQVYIPSSENARYRTIFKRRKCDVACSANLFFSDKSVQTEPYKEEEIEIKYN